MFALDRLSFTLGHQYGIKVYIGFSEFYGCTGPITEVIKGHKNDDSKLGQELAIARKRIVSVADLQFNLSKDMIDHSMRKVFNQVKENIPQNKHSEVLCAVKEIIREIVFGIRDAPHTCEEWEKSRTGTAEKLYNKMRDMMMEHLNDSCKTVCDVYKEEFEKTWRETLKKII